MKFYNILIKLLHRIYRKDEFIKAFIEAVQALFNKAETNITRLLNILHFNRLDEAGCNFWEKFLKIKNIQETISERQADIRARWRAKGHNSIALIQNIMDAWNPGVSVVDFLEGIILIKITAEEFVLKALKNVLKTIDDVKTAHLGLKLDVVQKNRADIRFYGHTRVSATVLILSDEV